MLVRVDVGEATKGSVSHMKKFEPQAPKGSELVLERLLSLCVSPSECPAHLTPGFCILVFYLLSFLHLPVPPVRVIGQAHTGHENFTIQKTTESWAC
jgi:hypothetical protein